MQQPEPEWLSSTGEPCALKGASTVRRGAHRKGQQCTSLGAYPYCPGNTISAGKRKSGKPTKGNKADRAVLCEIAWVISHMSSNYLSAHYRRLQRRLGPKQAALAVAHSVLVIIYHVLRDREPYHDLGADYFRQLDQERLVHHSVRQLQALGYEVVLTAQEEVSD